jgi:hypothetical protein
MHQTLSLIVGDSGSFPDTIAASHAASVHHPSVSRLLSKRRCIVPHDHNGLAYRFESDAGDVPPTLARQEIVERAIYWATSFYRDDSLEFVELAFKTQPIRFWLVTFKKGGTHETFCAVLLPDGTIIEPIQEEQT